ncbi:MAG: pseudouridine synthase [Verrucomicrobiales bacterium]
MSENGVRLNKFLASCGAGSRRACDALIQAGEVVVNGRVCDNPAYRVQPGDFVKMGNRVFEPLETLTLAFHKPAGLVCSRQDEEGKKTIYDVLPPKYRHLAHVGRLDKDSEGLLILTNDGKLAQTLTHPGHRTTKMYHVTLDQAFDNEIIDKLVKGVRTPEGVAKAVSVKRLSSRRLEMVLDTGLKRQIRLMLQVMGYRVKRLVRHRIGGLYLADLKLAKWRTLDAEDLAKLLDEESGRETPGSPR